MKKELSNEPFDPNRDADLEKEFALFERDLRLMTGSTLSKIKNDIIASQIPVLKNIKSGFGTSAISVFDFEEKKFLYVEDAIEEVTGISKATYLNKGIKYLFSRVSYDNIPALLRSTMHERKFLAKLHSSEYSNFIVNREYSYRLKHGRRWILQQTIKHLLNAQGKLFGIITLETNIDHLKLDGKYRYYIYDKRLNKIVYPKEISQPSLNKDSLSKREQEIVEFLVAGHSNRQVATKLNISFHTVRTHRKTIFKKLGCKNIVELIHALS